MQDSQPSPAKPVPQALPTTRHEQDRIASRAITYHLERIRTAISGCSPFTRALFALECARRLAIMAQNELTLPEAAHDAQGADEQ